MTDTTRTIDPDLIHLLIRPLTDWSQAVRWVRSMHAIGYGCHPDDPGADIVDTATGEATFTPAQASLYDARMAEVFALVDDPYSIGLDALGLLEEGPDHA